MRSADPVAVDRWRSAANPWNGENGTGIWPVRKNGEHIHDVSGRRPESHYRGLRCEKRELQSVHNLATFMPVCKRACMTERWAPDDLSPA